MPRIQDWSADQFWLILGNECRGLIRFFLLKRRVDFSHLQEEKTTGEEELRRKAENEIFHCISWSVGLSDPLHLRGTALPAHIQRLRSSNQRSLSTNRGWLQPRPRWSSLPCRSQSLWASLTPPWITTPNWRRWWCSALRGHPSSLPPHPRVQALAPGNQESSTTTLLEVRKEPLSAVFTQCSAEVLDHIWWATGKCLI